MKPDGVADIATMGRGKVAIEGPVRRICADGNETDHTGSLGFGAVGREGPRPRGLGGMAVRIEEGEGQGNVQRMEKELKVESEKMEEGPEWLSG